MYSSRRSLLGFVLLLFADGRAGYTLGFATHFLILVSHGHIKEDEAPALLTNEIKYWQFPCGYSAGNIMGTQ